MDKSALIKKRVRVGDHSITLSLLFFFFFFFSDQALSARASNPRR